MREHPIIFSGPMVCAILEGRKTQTRRVMKPQPEGLVKRCPGLNEIRGASQLWTDGVRVFSCPHGTPGDVLWARETWAPFPNDPARRVEYRAGYEAPGVRGHVPMWSKRWRPSIHMPRWASRLTLRLTDVRVQRVQEISPEDAEAEGCWRTPDECSHVSIQPPEFRDVWDSLNVKRGYGWDVNPFCWALTFEVKR